MESHRVVRSSQPLDGRALSCYASGVEEPMGGLGHLLDDVLTMLLEQDDEGMSHTTPFGFDLEESAESVKITIVGGDGQVINRYDLGAVAAGVDSFSWDGKTSQGESAVPGAYRVRIEATNDDEPVPVEALNYAMVGGVTPPDDQGGVRLDLGAVYGQVSLDQVRQIL